MWLHSSVGGALHQYCGGHGFESCWSPDFCRLHLFNCLNWKIYCNDHSSLSSTIPVQIWIISYIFHISVTFAIQVTLEDQDDNEHNINRKSIAFTQLFKFTFFFKLPNLITLLTMKVNTIPLPKNRSTLRSCVGVAFFCFFELYRLRKYTSCLLEAFYIIIIIIIIMYIYTGKLSHP